MKSSVQKKMFQVKTYCSMGIAAVIVKNKFYFNEFNSSNEVFAA